MGRDIPFAWRRYSKAAAREFKYQYQKLTKTGVDIEFENRIRRQAELYLGGEPDTRGRCSTVVLSSIDLKDDARFSVFRPDIYKRFVEDANGEERDEFGRNGRWIPRGCVVYYDHREATYVKVFDKYAATKGEARFLPKALEKGFYDFLCPHLEYLIVDDETILRGYAIREGRPVSRYEFDRYVGGVLRDVVLFETARTGLYLNDLEFHNVVRTSDALSIIDLESVLPISWFETDIEFARLRLDEVDIGWPIQSKWCSPIWYKEFLRGLQNPGC